MRQILCLIVLIFFFGKAGAQQTEKEKSVNEYVYYDETHFTILNTKDSRLERKYKVKILNKYADDYKRIMLFYDKFQKIASLKATITDENGKIIKRYSLKDAKDYQYDISSIASDTRVKSLEIDPGHYPYILEVSYQEDYKGSLFYPAWHPVGDEKQYIEKSTFVVSDLQNLGIRYLEMNVGEPQKEAEGNGFRYTWSVEGVDPFFDEPLARLSSVLPIVYVAPVNFEINGLKGNMESWKNLGLWMNELAKGRNDLKPEDVETVRQLCEPLTTVREKVKAVYQYMQNNTRYISIQLGMGGWQPFPASYVHQKKYGDCKALSFYTKALLESVGVVSYYTLIRGGRNEEPIPENYSSAHFNHVILTVPMEQDTVWLECTSQTNPFGYLGSFTSDRYGLMITPEGGVLVRTRKYDEEDNLQLTRTHFEVTPEGHAVVAMLREMKGIQLEKSNFMGMLKESDTEKRKWVQDNIDYGNLELRTLAFKELSGDECPVAGYGLEGVLKNFCTLNGNRLFVSPLVFSTIKDIRLAAEKRTFPIEVRFPYTQLDTVVAYIPENFSMETMLNPVKIESPYGSYSVTVEPQDRSYRFVRRFVLKAGCYPVSEYEAFKAFVTQVQTFDRSRFVLVRKP